MAVSDLMLLARALHLSDLSGSLQLERWAYKPNHELREHSHKKVYSDDQAHWHPLRSQRNRIHDPHNRARDLKGPWRPNPNPGPAYAITFCLVFRDLMQV